MLELKTVQANTLNEDRTCKQWPKAQLRPVGGHQATRDMMSVVIACSVTRIPYDDNKLSRTVACRFL